jgi:hypothetical protein
MGRQVSVRRFSIVIACVAAGISSTPRAEDIAAARACVGIAQNPARLECYDQAFGVSAPNPEAQFGDTGQLRAKLAPKEKLPKSVIATVRSAQPLAQGLYRLSLDNGQVWRTLEADWALHFQSSDSVTISRLPLGGYQISTAGSGRSVGAKRIQ